MNTMFEWEYLGGLEYKIIVRWLSTVKTYAYVRYDGGAETVRIYFECSIRQEDLEPINQVVRQIAGMIAEALSKQSSG